MAHLKNGILSGITGVIGPVEGYVLNGQYIIRSRRSKAAKPPTDKQLACRQKMKLVNRFLKPIRDFVKIGFAAEVRAKQYNGYNAAIADLLKHAVTGSYPVYQIDYTKVRVSSGPIPPAFSALATLEGSAIRFTWTSDPDAAKATDRVVLVVYAPELDKALYTLCGAARWKETDVLQLPDGWQHERLETYLAFVAENSNTCSDSTYTGSPNFNP